MDIEADTEGGSANKFRHFGVRCFSTALTLRVQSNLATASLLFIFKQTQTKAFRQTVSFHMRSGSRSGAGDSYRTDGVASPWRTEIADPLDWRKPRGRKTEPAI